MKTKLNSRARSVWLALLASAGVLAGCASDGPGAYSAGEAVGPVGVWSPHSRARFITLERSTTYAIVREDGRDLIVIEEGIDGGLPGAPDRFVWIVSIPHDAPIGGPVAFGPDENAAWLLEYRKGQNTHAQRVSGSVTVMARSEDALDAQVDLTAPGNPEAPGQLSTNDVTLAARLGLDRYQSFVPGTEEAMTRSGADGAVDTDPTPRSVYGVK